MTNCLKGHLCGGRRRGNESLISPHLRFQICAATPLIASVVNFRPQPPSLHIGAPYVFPQLSTFNLQLVRGRPQRPFKIKNLLQKIKTSSSNPIKSNQGFIDEKNSEFFSRRFHGKSLANQRKTPQKTPQKWSKNPRFLTCQQSALTIQNATAFPCPSQMLLGLPLSTSRLAPTLSHPSIHQSTHPFPGLSQHVQRNTHPSSIPHPPSSLQLSDLPLPKKPAFSKDHIL